MSDPNYQPYPQQPYGQQPYGYPQPQQPGNGLAIASLVCGIIGLLIFWIVLSPLAIIFGGIGLAKANRGAKYRGQAIAGLVLGIVAILGYIILIAVVVNDHNFVV
jgi:hypothetical protein